MRGISTGILRIAFVTAVVAAGASLCFTARKGVDGDLLALIGPSAEVAELRSAADAMAKSARFLVKAGSEDAARARLAALGVRLPQDPSGLSAALRTLAPYARGFLSPAVRGQLERGEFAAVRDAAVARLFSPMPPVLPPDRDPFQLFTDYVMSASSPKGEWTMVNAELTPAEALAALMAVRGADDVRCAGTPFHTAVASERSKREINILSAISLFCALLFGWLLTRSFRFVPVLAAALGAAFCVASAALFAVFPKPHLMTFVFGTTLIGLGVDYVYHALVAQRSIARPLTFSFLSTAVCFLPLLFSSVGVMRQMAVFTVAGLSAVYAGVLAFGIRRSEESCQPSPGTEACKPPPAPARTWLMAAAIVFFALSLMVVSLSGGGMQKGTDISRFYRPDPYLAEGERLALESAGGVGFVPSAEEQRRNVRLVQRLYEAEGKNLCAMTGLPEKVLSAPSEFKAFNPKGAMESLFDRWLLELDRLMVFSFAMLCVALVAMFRRRCAGFLLPMCIALAATEMLLICMGENRNFFARICFFIFIGLGLDYCVFRWHARQSPHRPSGNAVWYSFLTSLVAFGMLGFTEFAVTRLMGITLAFGLAVAYLAAKLFCGATGDAPPASRWHEQSEQCASRFWMQFMWYSYAWLGKTFQKAIFLFAMPFIYSFSRPARAALRKFYGVLAEHQGKAIRVTRWRLFRHLLGFAWGLMDKTDAATLKKNLPQMSVRDDDGWRAFKGLVDSGKGAFLLCTHVSTIGVLPALSVSIGGRVPKVHAFQQMGHDAIFMKVFMRHFDSSGIELHAVEDIGVETAVAMQEAIGRGELVIMAGDRTSAGSKGVLRHEFLGRGCAWPKGAFRFAQLMEAPVFAVTCISSGWNRYEAHFAALDRTSPLDGYVKFLEAEATAHPDQWYQFYDFFGGGDD